MATKKEEKETYSELIDWCTRYLFDGLIVGGTKEMHSRMTIVFNRILQWKEQGK